MHIEENRVVTIKAIIRRMAKLDQFSPQQQKEYDAASRALIFAGWCPICEADGVPARLGRWQSGTADTYAGRECSQCEEFFPSGPQIEFDHTPETHSDADPGL